MPIGLSNRRANFSDAEAVSHNQCDVTFPDGVPSTAVNNALSNPVLALVKQDVAPEGCKILQRAVFAVPLQKDDGLACEWLAW